MYIVGMYYRVRRACLVEGMSIREASRVFGMHRDTVRKMLSHSVPPGYRMKRPPRRPKLDPYKGVIDRILEDDERAPRKQRHTAKRIFDRLKAEHGFEGGYTIVKDYVRERRRVARAGRYPRVESLALRVRREREQLTSQRKCEGSRVGACTRKLLDVQHSSRNFYRDYLAVVDAPAPEPLGPGAVQGERAAAIQEAVMERRGLLRLRQQQEGVPLESVLGHLREDQGVPASAHRQPGDLGRPGADGLVGNDATLVASGKRHTVRTANDVGYVGGSLKREAQMALSAVWEPTIETNQRPSVRSSRAKASAVALNPPAEIVKRSSGLRRGLRACRVSFQVNHGCRLRGDFPRGSRTALPVLEL